MCLLKVTDKLREEGEEGEERVTNEIDDKPSIGAATGCMLKKGLSIRKLSDDGKCKGTGEKEISGVAEGIAEVEYCLVGLKT